MKIDKQLVFALLGIIGSVLLFVGSFLAWVIITNLPRMNTIYGLSLAEGIMLLIIGYLGVIATIITAAYTTKITAIFMVVIGIVSLLTCIIDIASLNAIVFGPYLPTSPLEAGIGIYLCLIGSILILVAGLMFLLKALKKID